MYESLPQFPRAENDTKATPNRINTAPLHGSSSKTNLNERLTRASGANEQCDETLGIKATTCMHAWA